MEEDVGKISTGPAPFVEFAQHELGCALMCRIMEEFSRQKLLQLRFSRKKTISVALRSFQHSNHPAISVEIELRTERFRKQNNSIHTNHEQPPTHILPTDTEEQLNHTAHKSQFSSVN
jgi:hypothetical protein